MLKPKQIISTVLAVMMIVSMIPASVSAAEASFTADIFISGDVDGSGKVESADARLALRASVKLEELNENQKKAADVDGNGKIEASDARLILRASVGLESSDLEKAESVIGKISAIGDVTTEKKAQIEAARAAYDELSDDAKAIVQNYEGKNYLKLLESAEAELAELEKNEADKAAAKAVEELIDAIGEVVYTPECKAKITAAKNAYNELTKEQQALVSNMDKYYAADNAYRELEMAYRNEMAKVMPLIQRVENLGEITLEDKAEIEAIRAAYEALIDDAKAKFRNFYGVNYLIKLEAAEAELKALEKA